MIVVNATYCPQNHHCPTLRMCPTGALQQQGFGAPTIDEELCIDCGKCTSRCPVFSQVSGDAPIGGSNGVSGVSAGTTPSGSLLQRFRR